MEDKINFAKAIKERAAAFVNIVNQARSAGLRVDLTFQDEERSTFGGGHNSNLYITSKVYEEVK